LAWALGRQKPLDQLSSASGGSARHDRSDGGVGADNHLRGDRGRPQWNLRTCHGLQDGPGGQVLRQVAWGVNLPARVAEKEARAAASHGVERPPLVVVYLVYDEGTKVAAGKLERQSNCESGQSEAQGRHGQRHPLEAAASHGPFACGQPGNRSGAKSETESIQMGRARGAAFSKGARGGCSKVSKPSVVEMAAAAFSH
jgi:hypothetical protein